MANAYSTAGIAVQYGTGASASAITSWTPIPGVKSIPEYGTDVNTLQTTPLTALLNHTYIEGLRDSGGAIGLTVNDYDAFRTAWDQAVTAYGTLESGNQMYWKFTAPNGAASTFKAFVFPGKPIPYGFGGADVDEVFENTANILPEGDFAWV